MSSGPVKMPISFHFVLIILFMSILPLQLFPLFSPQWWMKGRFGGRFRIVQPFCCWVFWKYIFFCRKLCLTFWMFGWSIWPMEVSFSIVWRPCLLTLHFWLLFRGVRFFFCWKWWSISSFKKYNKHCKHFNINTIKILTLDFWGIKHFWKYYCFWSIGHRVRKLIELYPIITSKQCWWSYWAFGSLDKWDFFSKDFKVFCDEHCSIF